MTSGLLFLGELVNNGTLHHFTYISILNEITGSIEQVDSVHRDRLLIVLLRVLPFVSKFFQDNCEMEFKNLLEELEKIIAARKQKEVSVLWLIKNNDHEKDAILQHWSICRHYIDNSRKCDVFDDGFDDILNEHKPSGKPLRKNFEKIEFSKTPVSESITANQIYPIYLAEIFVEVPETKEGEEAEEGQVSAPSQDDLVIRTTMFNMIDSLKSNVPIITGKILFFSFKPRSYVNYHLALDYIFASLMRAETKQSHIIFLSALSRHLCDDEDDGTQFEKSLLRRCKVMFTNLHKFELRGIENFISYFALLKTNHDLPLDWMVPVADEADDENTTQLKDFVRRGILRDIMELTHFDDLFTDEKIAPVTEYIPDKPDPVLDIASDDHEEHQIYQLIVDRFRSKLNSEEIKTFLSSNEILKGYTEDIVFLFIQILFYESAPSLSHLNSYTEKYEVIMRQHCEKGDDAKLQLLETIDNIWKNSYFNIAITIQRVIKRELIPITLAADWLLEKMADSSLNLGKNKLYTDIIKKTLRIIISNKERLRADKNNNLEIVVEKLQDDFSALLTHITKKASDLAIAASTDKQRDLILSRLKELLLEFWSDSISSRDSLKQEIERIGDASLAQWFENLKGIAA